MIPGWRTALHLLLVACAAAGLAACDSPPPCRLCDAIEAGDVAGVRTLLAQGEAVTADALERAADPTVVVTRRGGSVAPADREIVEALLDAVDPDARWMRLGGALRGGQTSGSQRPVYLAAALMELWGDRAIVERLLQRGLDVKGVPGGEALRQAVISQRADAVRELLAAGAPVNHVGVHVAERTTPLAEAIQTRNLELIAWLEAAGAVEWID